MRVLVYLGHPAHFHLYKNVISNLKNKGHKVDILIKKKDVLEELLQNAGLEYHNILNEERKGSKIDILMGVLKRAYRLYRFVSKNKPDILTGTSVENSLIGPLKRIPVINLEEDDAAVIPLYAKLTYPTSSVILTPTVCDNGKWNKVSTKYESYHELAYLHPNHFTADKKVVEKYFSIDKPFVILRFAKLNAHHDFGIKGINDEITRKLLEILSPKFNIYITSERELESEFEQYRINIKPIDMHHVMAFASLYIGDSQTMAAEAGVLGIPFVRFNDFVGRIGYLKELEEKYELGYGIKTTEIDKLYSTISMLVDMENRNDVFSARKNRLFNEKIDFAKFLTWFIENYPESKKIMKENPDYQNRFK